MKKLTIEGKETVEGKENVEPKEKLKIPEKQDKFPVPSIDEKATADLEDKVS